MNKKDDINDYLPSLICPRGIRKDQDLALTQNSVVSRCSLSLKRSGLSQGKKSNHKVLHSANIQNINNNVQQKPTFNRKINTAKERSLISAEEELNHVFNREKNRNAQNIPPTVNAPANEGLKDKNVQEVNVGLSDVEEFNSVRNETSSPFSFGELCTTEISKGVKNGNHSLITVSSATELTDHTITLDNSETTIPFDDVDDDKIEPIISVSFGVLDCDIVNVSTKNSNIKKIEISHRNNATNIDCEVIESSIISIRSKRNSTSMIGSDTYENMNEISPSPPKKIAVAVNLEIKKKTQQDASDSKILILNTDDIHKLSHVIVQPPNYKLVKRQIANRSKFKADKSKSIDGKCCDNLKQKRIDDFLCRKTCSTEKVPGKSFVDGVRTGDVIGDDGQDMSKDLGVASGLKCDRVRSLRNRKDESTPRAVRVLPKRDVPSPRQQALKTSTSESPRVPSARARVDGGRSQSPKKNVNGDSLQFNLPLKSQSSKGVSPRNVPYYKIVAGTHFAVDAFSYGEIPNVKHYFLTHFHSDHYSGLKKSFNKLLFCSKITADLCVTRIGVNPKFIHIMNCEDTISVDGVDVTAVDANHCPGAIMLAFTLPNGKTLLHTGDFRASPPMESYPVFWNKDINTIYLDTTYCNPRYDFPTQEQSIEMAMYLLRQKKLALEKLGKKFSSVLIVCGTYTIGKEKFFLNIARRVGCAVWACPEKDRVLRAAEGRSFSHAPPHTCQLHVVPMRDLAPEKLRSYLEDLQGAFSEVVAFKPSGWENGRTAAVQKDNVTIHGIPYSEHSSFSELIRFVNFLKPKQIVPTVDISGGVKSVQKYFPCPLVCQAERRSQGRLTDYFGLQGVT